MTHPHFSRTQLRRAVLSSYLGSVIEYYDFLLYATASAVVFNKVFFSNLDPLVGTVASFGTLATGYFARPLGGIVFGHFGDRIGRKKMLVLSMALMGVGSTLIGLLPTYAQIGVWAPILLVLLRVVQGIAVGGEWGGAVLMSAEHATSRRGLWASFTNAGAPSGMVLSTLVLAASASLTGEEAVPGLGLADPVPAQHRAAGHRPVRARPASPRRRCSPRRPREKPARPPLLEVLRHHPRNLAAVDRRRLRRVRRAGHAHHVRHLLRGASRLPPADRAQRAHALLGRGDLRHHRVLRAVGPRSGGARSSSPAPRRWPSGPSLLFPLIDSGSTAAAHPRRRRRPGRRARRVVRAARRALHRAVLHPLPLHRRLARLPDRRHRRAASRPLVFASVLAAGGGTTVVSTIIAAAACSASAASSPCARPPPPT